MTICSPWRMPSVKPAGPVIASPPNPCWPRSVAVGISACFAGMDSRRDMTPPTPRGVDSALPATFATPDGAVAAARAAHSVARGVPPQRPRVRRAQPAAVPLGSIATTSNRTVPGTAVCAMCASTALTHLEMTLTDGTPVVFVSCHACEHKGWFDVNGDGTAMSLDAVLGSATKISTRV